MFSFMLGSEGCIQLVAMCNVKQDCPPMTNVTINKQWGGSNDVFVCKMSSLGVRMNRGINPTVKSATVGSHDDEGCLTLRT